MVPFGLTIRFKLVIYSVKFGTCSKTCHIVTTSKVFSCLIRLKMRLFTFYLFFMMYMCDENSLLNNPDKLERKPTKNPFTKLIFPFLYFSDNKET